MAKLKEQIATHAYGSRPAKQDDTLYITDEPTEEDDFIEDDDEDSYPRYYRRARQVSIERTCKEPRTPAANRTYLRVTRHAEPPPIERTPRTTASRPQQQVKQKPVKQAQKRLHWLFYVGVGMVGTFVLWMVVTTALSWLQTQHDNLVYGSPRHYDTDVNVGHQGVSHFICENLDGHIIVLETQVNDQSHSKVYTGPVFSDNDADTLVATLSFKDVNGDGRPDMIIAVNNRRFIMINTGSAFRPITSSDHIDQQEMQ